MGATYELRGDVAVITLSRPPVNDLGFETRQAVANALTRAAADVAVRAIVVAGAGRLFSGGADIREFGTPKALAEPHLHTLIAMVERSPKPVTAAIHGACMGGGLELALGCHYRVAAPGAEVALPEVKLGLVPGAGGTQRLPRAVGVATALEMIVGGEPMMCEALAAVSGQMLFDRIVDGELIDGAVSFARSVAGVRPLPRVRDRTAGGQGAQAVLQAARQRVQATAGPYPAPGVCVECIAASVELPFEDGLAFEGGQFLGLMRTPQSRALRHAFFGERAAGKIADVPEGTPTRAIAKVAVIGAGTMGSGIAMNFLDAGLPVTILETTPQALERGLATIRRNYESQVNKGRLAADACAQRMALMSGTLAWTDVADADLVIEAVFEDMEVKQRVFTTLDDLVRPGAILASNTSTLDLNRIAGVTRRAQDVVGMHFFSPAQVMKLLEVVRGERTAKDVLATVMALSRRIRKTAVVSGVCDGFIGNRMLEPYIRQAGFLLDEGCTPEQVDRAMESFGFAMGPFRMSDLAGNDIGWAIRRRRVAATPALRYSRTADLLCEMGRVGQKTGAGWYDYRPGSRDAAASPVVAEMLAAHRAELGLRPRPIDDDEILHRLVYALVNEGARILEEGIAGKAGDIDIVYLAGYGFPRWRGGPMFYADTQGLGRVVQAMQRFAANPNGDTGFWQPAPLLAKLAAEGRTFT